METVGASYLQLLKKRKVEKASERVCKKFSGAVLWQPPAALDSLVQEQCLSEAYCFLDAFVLSQLALCVLPICIFCWVKAPSEKGCKEMYLINLVCNVHEIYIYEIKF